MEPQEDATHWFVMRDLKRANAKIPGYALLKDQGFEVFTPMKWYMVSREGKRVREKTPVIPDLLFVHSDRKVLDPVVEKTKTLQYRFLRNTWRDPMTVRDTDMGRFIHIVNSTESVRYYMPGELTPKMYNKKIRIIGGNLDGYEGNLMNVRGSKTRWLFVELPGLLAAKVKVSAEYIIFI